MPHVNKGPHAPLCRYCGGRIAKHGSRVEIKERLDPQYHRSQRGWRYVESAEPVTDKEGCRKFTNQQVLSVAYVEDYVDGEIDKSTRRVSFFTEWDGETYVDEFFCNGDHAKRFGYFSARNSRVTTVAYADSMREQDEQAYAKLRRAK